MLHGAATATDGIHVIQAWQVADAATRNALAVTTTDVGRVCRQLDLNQFWILESTTPTWRLLNIVNTDSVTEGATNKYFTGARVLATIVAGFAAGANTAVAATNTILEALGLLQGQISANATAIANNATAITNNTAAVAANTSKLKQFVPIAVSDESTALTAGTSKVTFRIPFAMTLSSVRASLTTAQATGALLTVDIKESGVSILSTKITLDNTKKTSTASATLPVLSDTSLADDAEITIDISQIGDGTAKGLKVYLIGSIT